jgi:hypothetical protein
MYEGDRMDSMSQTKYRRQPAPLSEALSKFIESGPEGIAQRYKTSAQLGLLWAQTLPPELARHCRIVGLSQGTLYVEADSPSFLYELRISSRELVQYLRQACPAAKVRTIKVVLASYAGP